MNKTRFIKQMGGVFIGSAIMAVALNTFLIPNRIASGGVSGLGIILYHLLNIPVGVTIFAFNLPLFLLAIKYLGIKSVVRSLSGTIFLSVLVEVFVFLPALTTDLLLATIYGGIALGIGLGLVFRSGGSTGGTALAAQLINYFRGYSVGQGLLGIDFLIIALAGVAFSAELAMYALISIFVTSKVIDFVQEGLSMAKACFIISENPRQITQSILGDMERGVTLLKGQGGYTKEDKDILLCVVSQSEITRLKRIVWGIDPNSFVIVSNVQEVLGEGFYQP